MEYNVNRFRDLLIDENLRQNLVSRRDPNLEIAKHIEDSLQLLDLTSLEEKKVVDIGSGAGFPGFILAMYCPQASFTLIEVDLKKSKFLERMILEMGLKNIAVLCRRVEEVGQDNNYRDGFDICTSRAVASMNILLEYALPLLRLGGRLILWKGRNYQEEINKSQNALRILGARVLNVYPYNLMGERDRVLIVVEKQEGTPNKYPRRVGIPSKRPL